MHNSETQNILFNRNVESEKRNEWLWFMNEWLFTFIPFQDSLVSDGDVNLSSCLLFSGNIVSSLFSIFTQSNEFVLRIDFDWNLNHNF